MESAFKGSVHPYTSRTLLIAMVFLLTLNGHIILRAFFPHEIQLQMHICMFFIFVELFTRFYLPGYDKLKPFSFPIHGAINGFSRKVLWLDVCKSNNSPSEPTNLYLDCVEEQGGCPMITRTDYGTENCNIAAIQSYFRSDEEAHKYGTSTRNQRIENWLNFWINFFKDLKDDGTIDLEQPLHRECLWFCFDGIIQASINKMKEYWNTHYIRPSRHDTIPGVPDILFYLPKGSSGVNCLVPVSNDKIAEMRMLPNENIDEDGEEENLYQEYFQYIMDHEEVEYPDSAQEAILLFTNLIEKAESEA